MLTFNKKRLFIVAVPCVWFVGLVFEQKKINQH